MNKFFIFQGVAKVRTCVYEYKKASWKTLKNKNEILSQPKKTQPFS